MIAVTHKSLWVVGSLQDVGPPVTFPSGNFALHPLYRFLLIICAACMKHFLCTEHSAELWGQKDEETGSPRGCCITHPAPIGQPL